MHYSVFHISILLDLLLVKSDLPKERSGLVKVLELIGDNAKVNQKKIDEQFLYKLDDRLNKLIKSEKTKIQVKSTAYIDNCSSYLGYGNYEEFVQELERVQTLVQPLLELQQEIIFQIPTSKQKNLSSLIKKFQFQYSIEVYKDSTIECLDKLNQIKNKSIIWFISSNLFDSQAKELKLWLRKKSAREILPYWLTDKASDLKAYQDIFNKNTILKGINDHDDLNLLIQLIIYYQENHRVKKEKRKKKKKNAGIIVKGNNSGFIINELNSETAPQITNNFYGEGNEG